MQNVHPIKPGHLNRQPVQTGAFEYLTEEALRHEYKLAGGIAPSDKQWRKFREEGTHSPTIRSVPGRRGGRGASGYALFHKELVHEIVRRGAGPQAKDGRPEARPVDRAEAMAAVWLRLPPDAVPATEVRRTLKRIRQAVEVRPTSERKAARELARAAGTDPGLFCARWQRTAAASFDRQSSVAALSRLDDGDAITDSVFCEAVRRAFSDSPQPLVVGISALLAARRAALQVDLDSLSDDYLAAVRVLARTTIEMAERLRSSLIGVVPPVFAAVLSSVDPYRPAGRIALLTIGVLHVFDCEPVELVNRLTDAAYQADRLRFPDATSPVPSAA